MFHNSAEIMRRKELMTQYREVQKYLSQLKENCIDYEMQLAKHNAEEEEFDRKIKRFAIGGFAVCAAVTIIMVVFALSNGEMHTYLL